VFAILDGIVKQYALDVGLVISGNARGIDRWGEQWADMNKIPAEKYIPKWETGKNAGMVRNTAMVEDCDCAIIVWDGMSKGTLDTITKIKDTEKPFWVARMAFMLQGHNIIDKDEELKQRAEASGLVLP
jgi:hypothetical protein